MLPSVVGRWRQKEKVKVIHLYTADSTVCCIDVKCMQVNPKLKNWQLDSNRSKRAMLTRRSGQAINSRGRQQGIYTVYCATNDVIIGRSAQHEQREVKYKGRNLYKGNWWTGSLPSSTLWSIIWFPYFCSEDQCIHKTMACIHQTAKNHIWLEVFWTKNGPGNEQLFFKLLLTSKCW